MRTHSLLPCLALLGLGLPGCILVIDKGGGGGPETGYPIDDVPPDSGWGDDTGMVACTDLAASSVDISVVDPSGAPLSGATVTWSVAGGPSQPAECMDAACTTFVAGWEVPGDITVVTSYSMDTPDPYCWYSDDEVDTVTVPMTADGCHVMTQQLTVTLDPTLEVCADADGG